jgi:hypothetical protein
MEIETQKNKTADEVDLKEFFRWLGNGFSRLGNGLLYSLASLRNLFFQNRLFFLGVIVIGLALGAVYSELLKKEYYKSTLVLSCDYLNTQILASTIEKLNLLCQEKDREGLAQLLDIDNSTALNVYKFEFQPFVSEDDVVEMEVLREQLNNVAADKKDVVEKVIAKLEIENKNAYRITALVYNPDIVKPLEKAIVNYFNSNPYIKRRIEINHANLKSRKTKLVQESNKLDSLKKVLFENYQNLGKTSRGSGNVFLGEEKLANPLDVFTADMKLNEDILDIDKALYLKPDFELVDGFTTFKQPESASLVKILFISFWVSFVMGYLIIGAWRLDKKLASYQTTN